MRSDVLLTLYSIRVYLAVSQFVVNPMLQALAAAFPAARPILLATQSNYEHWKQVRRC